MDDMKKVYEAPRVVMELDLETQAGSPGGCGTPAFPLPESELGKCK